MNKNEYAAMSDLPGSETQFAFCEIDRDAKDQNKFFWIIFSLSIDSVFPAVIPWPVSLIFISSYQAYFLKDFGVIGVLVILK